jgi:hypothetical protein
VIIPVSIGGEGLICPDTLDPNETFTRDHFISLVLSDVKKDTHHLCGRKHPIELAVHIDNSRRHKGQKGVDKVRPNRMIRLGHPSYSPDLSPGDFWPFGVLKSPMKETVVRNPDEVEEIVCHFWTEATLDEVRLVFQEWMRRLDWVYQHHGKAVPE